NYCVLLYFFTAAATAAADTLSLHDALPISLAYIAVGYRNYRNGEEATARLGLWKPTQQEVIVGLVAVIPAFILSMIGSVLTGVLDRKSTRLNSSHVKISYAVFCLKQKKEIR